MAKVLELTARLVRTWLFWMSGAFSLLVTLIVLVRAAYGAPISPSRTLVVFGCLGVIAFVISGITAWRHEHSIASGLRAQVERDSNAQAGKEALRDGLAALMLEGQAVRRRLASTDEPFETLEPDIGAWALKTETWLQTNLGTSYIARFRNGAGLPMGAFVMRREPNTKEGPLNGFMSVRLARLNEFITELS